MGRKGVLRSSETDRVLQDERGPFLRPKGPVVQVGSSGCLFQSVPASGS